MNMTNNMNDSIGIVKGNFGTRDRQTQKETLKLCTIKLTFREGQKTNLDTLKKDSKVV